MQILIEAGASINTAGNTDWSPLHLAARFEYIELLKARP